VLSIFWGGAPVMPDHVRGLDAEHRRGWTCWTARGLSSRGPLPSAGTTPPRQPGRAGGAGAWPEAKGRSGNLAYPGPVALDGKGE
jgi:hypothetical protein